MSLFGVNPLPLTPYGHNQREALPPRDGCAPMRSATVSEMGRVRMLYSAVCSEK